MAFVEALLLHTELDIIKEKYLKEKNQKQSKIKGQSTLTDYGILSKGRILFSWISFAEMVKGDNANNKPPLKKNKKQKTK